MQHVTNAPDFINMKRATEDDGSDTPANKEICNHFFELVPGETKSWNCKACFKVLGKFPDPVIADTKYGYKNLISHLDNNHEGYLDGMKTELKQGTLYGKKVCT